jgi:hypothetical protein
MKSTVPTVSGAPAALPNTKLAPAQHRLAATVATELASGRLTLPKFTCSPRLVSVIVAPAACVIELFEASRRFDVPAGAIAPWIVTGPLLVVPMRSTPDAEVFRLLICALVMSSVPAPGAATPRLIGVPKAEVRKSMSEPLVTA